MLPIWRYFFPISIWGVLFAWRNIRDGMECMNYVLVGMSICGAFATVGLFIAFEALLLPASLAAALTAGVIMLVAPEPKQAQRVRSA
ncbi:hypothetical protein ACNHKD_13005 [Methylocystis sp. JAN1]|uniref:hypothetical protein n=1 Tax=Methylocystis sp. JAN1 TaxID=3397211 RepID=UPI003FA1BEE4